MDPPNSKSEATEAKGASGSDDANRTTSPRRRPVSQRFESSRRYSALKDTGPNRKTRRTPEGYIWCSTQECYIKDEARIMPTLRREHRILSESFLGDSSNQMLDEALNQVTDDKLDLPLNGLLDEASRSDGILSSSSPSPLTRTHPAGSYGTSDDNEESKDSGSTGVENDMCDKQAM